MRNRTFGGRAAAGRKIRRAAVPRPLGPLLIAALAALAAAPAPRAQDVPAPAPAPGQTATPAWRLVADGDTLDWAPPRAVPPDSAAAASALALAHLQRGGFVLARIDSARADAAGAVLFATRGARARVGTLALEGVRRLDAEAERARFDTRPGAAFDADALERDVAALLDAYDRAGAALATVAPALTLDAADPAAPRVDVRLVVDEGPEVNLDAVELVGARQTSPRHAARVAGLVPGAPLTAYDPDGIRRELEATGLFEEVGPPELALTDSGGAVVRVPVRERAPGTFDLLLGYLPASVPGEGGSFVGNGLLELRNLFGTGRQVRVRLVRNPGLVSSLEARVFDPYLLGLPLQVEAAFEGYGQDSTFARQRYRLGAGYRVAPGLDVLASATREAVAPGPFGAQLVDGRPRVAASSAVFGGVGLRYRRLDAPVSPRRGLSIEAVVEQGFRRRTLPDSTGEPATVRQQRLTATGRLFVPVSARQVLVAGGDAFLVLAGRAAGGATVAAFDEGDLVRFGGARSLRGYDEEQFLANAAGRALVEYRYLLDRASYAFAFVDVGYAGRPGIPGYAGFDDWLPGYGFGAQVRTALGLIVVTYALNPDLGVGQGKVHAGLSFGL